MHTKNHITKQILYVNLIARQFTILHIFILKMLCVKIKNKNQPMLSLKVKKNIDLGDMC